MIGSWSGSHADHGRNLRESFLEIAGALRATARRQRAAARHRGGPARASSTLNKALIRYSIPLRIEAPLDFRREVADRYDLPVFIENDANACAWGELVFHRSRRLRDFVFVLSEFRRVEEHAAHPRAHRRRHGHRHRRQGAPRPLLFRRRVPQRLLHAAKAGASSHSRTTRRSGSSEDSDILCRFIRRARRQRRDARQHLQPRSRVPRRRHRALPRAGRARSRAGDPAQLALPGRGAVPRGAFPRLGEKACAYGAAAVVLQRLLGDLDMPGRLARVFPLAAPGFGRARASIDGSEPPLSGEPPDSREISTQARARNRAGQSGPGRPPAAPGKAGQELARQASGSWARRRP